MNRLSEEVNQGIGMTSQRTRDRLIERLREQGIRDERVLEVMRNTPRHLFVDEALAHRAYEDTALPIGHGQTISQPYIVARMTELLLEHGSPHSVLEIGTGCGYQTLVLAQLVSQVYSIERIGALHEQARRRLENLKIYNVALRHTDGSGGWPNRNYRFNRILLTAAASEIPGKLLEQLRDGGEMILPLDSGRGQQLLRIIRRGDDFETESFEPVIFVPLLPGVSP